MTISALPAAPSRADTPDVFVAKADAFVAALATLVTEMNAALGVVNITEWITGTTYAIGDVVWSPADFQGYRRKTAGAGATDPSADTTNWQRTEISATSIQTQSATAFTTAGTAPAFTLTPSPALGAYAANQRFRVKFNAAGTTGSNTLNISGLGVKNLKQYDQSGVKTPAIIAANQLADVEYDGTDLVVLNPLSAVPVGSTLYVPGNAAPAGYVKKNGALLSRTTYAALYAYAVASGNMAASDGAWTAGEFSPGDGSTTFRIPDGRGEFIRGWDDGRGIDTGRAIGTYQADELKTHTHTVPIANGGPGASNASGYYTTASNTTTAATGGTETRPRNVAELACIKY